MKEDVGQPSRRRLTEGRCGSTESTLLWTIVGKMLTENHALSTLHTSFVDLEIEWADCNRCKKKLSLSNTLIN
jgi:hypothetical protein